MKDQLATTHRRDGGDSPPQGVKRKRLAKACDACHKSKRRCDGTAPCSNCFFASKVCSYTDHASGRSVPPPRASRGDRPASSAGDDSRGRKSKYDTAPPSSSSQPFLPPAEIASSSRSAFDSGSSSAYDGRAPTRTLPAPNNGPVVAAPVALDATLTVELVNLFFTHCHPHRLIIHKPTFISDMAHNQVPSYLLHIVCALGAVFSKQPRLRTIPQSEAGDPLALEATRRLFDSEGRLLLPPSLQLVQALCLLQIYHIKLKTPADESVSYHKLIPRLLEQLSVFEPDHPRLTPRPSREFLTAFIERECIRRVFWLVYLIECASDLWLGNPVKNDGSQLSVRLPMDETSFELALHASLSEYLHLPAPTAQWSSEFGHSIRITSMLRQIELTVRPLNGAPLSQYDVDNLRTTLQTWEQRLPERLSFSQDTLMVQLSMFETGMNSHAWCFCYMHAVHACCILSLAKSYPNDNQSRWALDRLDTIIAALGKRARNTMLVPVVVWTLKRHGFGCQNYPLLSQLAADYEDLWGPGSTDFVGYSWKSRAPAYDRSPPTAPADLRYQQQHYQHQHQHHPSHPHPYPRQHSRDGRLSAPADPASRPSSAFGASASSTGAYPGSPPYQPALLLAGPGPSSSSLGNPPAHPPSGDDSSGGRMRSSSFGGAYPGQGVGGQGGAGGNNALPSLKSVGLLDVMGAGAGGSRAQEAWGAATGPAAAEYGSHPHQHPNQHQHQHQHGRRTPPPQQYSPHMRRASAPMTGPGGAPPPGSAGPGSWSNMSNVREESTAASSSYSQPQGWMGR